MCRFGAPLVVQGLDDMTVWELQATFLYAMKDMLDEKVFREVIKFSHFFM